MKKNILFGLIILSFVLAGCKQDVKEEKEASTEVTKELATSIQNAAVPFVWIQTEERLSLIHISEPTRRS